MGWLVLLIPLVVGVVVSRPMPRHYVYTSTRLPLVAETSTPAIDDTELLELDELELYEIHKTSAPVCVAFCDKDVR
jgi:hypothetical protein